MNSSESSSQTFTRRNWFGVTFAAATSVLMTSENRLGASETSVSQNALKKPEAALRLSSWYNMIPGSLPSRLGYLEAMGMDGIELRGVGQLPNGVDGSPLTNMAYYREVLRDTPLKPTALDWSNLAAMVCPVANVRQKAIDSLKHAIEVAGELGAPNIIMVPPRIGKGFELPGSTESRQILLETLPGLGELAVQAGTCLLIEPCTRKIVNCLHTVSEVAGFVREMKCPGINIVADFDLMMVEETNITGAILSGGNYVKQVHLSGGGRRMPGFGKEDKTRYQEGFLGLKMTGYQGYCSFECGNVETFQVQFAQSIEFLRNAWEQA
ncbi:MAG: sugar phosphate isomerase/epimerase family protein [Verrucomicrobiota bacterium]